MWNYYLIANLFFVDIYIFNQNIIFIMMIKQENIINLVSSFLFPSLLSLSCVRERGNQNAKYKLFNEGGRDKG
jgi:hypothetical protein